MRDLDATVKTVLLVEDFDDSRFMMRRLLEMDGYRVVEAKTGREAVEYAEEAPFADPEEALERVYAEEG